MATNNDAEPNNTSAPSWQSGNPLVTACKRRITELEQELLDTKQRHAKNKTREKPIISMGRSIRRLVSLADRVEDLVGEADRRACMDASETSTPTEAQDHLYRSYKELIRWQPTLQILFSAQEDVHALSMLFKDLNHGADAARGDDAASLKPVVIHWLMSARPVPDPPLNPVMKEGRGFDHDVTGRLLCPVDYNWDDPIHRARIRDRHADFLVTAYSWPAYLYEDEKYDSNDPTKGFLKNRLLVKAFKQIFTSPTSAAKMDENASERPQKRKREANRHRSHVAALLGMNTVCPRAIAYIAVQLRFALSDCGSWCLYYAGFDYMQFYNNLVMFFENAEAPEDKERNADLLSWWNQSIVGKNGGVTCSPSEPEKMSVAKCLPQRGQQLPSAAPPQ